MTRRERQERARRDAQRQQPRPALPVDDRSPIDAAIDAVEAKQLEEELATLEARQAVRIPMLQTPHAWTGNEEVVVDAIPGDVPTFLMWDAGQGGFRPIMLPDGTRWRITPERSPAAGGLWTPEQGAPA